MATVFSTKDPNPGVWFIFDEKDPESGRIRIRAINKERLDEIRKKCIKKKVEYKNHQRFEYVESDDEMHSRMWWDYVIAEWENLEDDEGKPLVCDTDTKVFLMQNNVGFSTFVNQCFEKLNEDEENRVARLKKTSSKESSDSKTNQTAKSAKS